MSLPEPQKPDQSTVTTPVEPGSENIAVSLVGPTVEPNIPSEVKPYLTTTPIVPDVSGLGKDVVVTGDAVPVAQVANPMVGGPTPDMSLPPPKRTDSSDFLYSIRKRLDRKKMREAA